MRCLNCNLTIPEGARQCPACKAKVSDKFVRCSECFSKIKKDLTVCPKCGCDLTRQSDLKFEFYAEPKKTNLIKKAVGVFRENRILSFSLVFAALLILVVSMMFYNINKENEYIKNAKFYFEKTEQSMEYIDELAKKYNAVYDGKWLNQMDNISRLEHRNADEIKECKSDRDSLNFLHKSLIEQCNQKDSEKIIIDVFESYEKCYLYVVEKHGKYPGYMEGYNKIYQDYMKNINSFKKYINSKGK